ncbi:hypothetical protein AU467_25895 [Mesorhizobium loti]|uniref:Methyltransferase n=1 Tax=Rhizobium loti TaxID=381 RepID=A0A101KRG1_RHILI|nr:hypothetical protein AU467_25895 [Mesorhizobium loti]
MNTREPERNVRDGTIKGHIEEGAAFLALAKSHERTPESAPLPSPSRITDNAFAFQRTAALRAAVGLDIFTAIGEGHDTPATLAERCGAAERGIRILCDYLSAIELLSRKEGRYIATADAAAYLDRRSPAFIGDALRFVASETALKAVLGDPVAVVRNGGTILDETEHFGAPDQADWSTYARLVAPMMARSAALLADLVAGGDALVKRILDIAAGPGQNGIALARRLPDAHVRAVDWPSVLEIAAENALIAGLDERWRALSGSALEMEFGGPYDVAIVARFLHLLAPQDRESLLRRVHAALAPGGRIVVLQTLLDEDRASPPFAVAMNFNILATTPSGEVATTGEFEALIHRTGFGRLGWHDIPDSDERIAIAWK